MKNTITLQLRRFPVTIKDIYDSSEGPDTIVLSKEHLRAAQLVGQSSKELVTRLYATDGYDVLDIGKPERLEVTLDLNKLFREGLME